MDEQTEELRDIFMDATDESTVTERQRADRGSLPEDEQRTNQQLEEVIGRMRETYEFRSDLPDEALRTIVRKFYAGADDRTIAEEVGVEQDVIVNARLDLHLIRESDRHEEISHEELQNVLKEGLDTGAIADKFGVDEPTIDRARAVLEAEDEARRASHRYQIEFEDFLPDTVISVRHTSDVREDGLEDATEGMETDVSL